MAEAPEAPMPEPPRPICVVFPKLLVAIVFCRLGLRVNQDVDLWFLALALASSWRCRGGRCLVDVDIEWATSLVGQVCLCN